MGRGVSAGEVEFLAKPFPTHVLLSRLAARTKRSSYPANFSGGVEDVMVEAARELLRATGAT